MHTLPLPVVAAGALSTASFQLDRPGWLVVACVAFGLAFLALRRRPQRPPSATGRSAPVPAAASAPSRRTSLPSAPLLAAGALAAGSLALAQTAAAHALLLALALAVLLGLTLASYRTSAAALGRRRAMVCVAARGLAGAALLCIVARPAWIAVHAEWEKPLLAVLADASRSMSIVDDPRAEQRATRMERLRQALDQDPDLLDRLEVLYEVRPFAFSGRARPAATWTPEPDESPSALAVAVRAAGQMRSAQGEPPVGILLLSDGGENTAGADVVTQAAEELARQQTALLAVGVGPEGEGAPGVEMEPLVVPARVGSRALLHATLAARVRGCAASWIEASMAWDGQAAESRRVRIDEDRVALREEFELLPPGPGVHRLTAQIALPAALGGARLERSAMVEVRDERVRVLMLEHRPRSEAAFAARALQGDPRFEVVQRLLAGSERDPGPADPGEFDVVVLGSVRREQLDSLAAPLAEAVARHGVGLLLAGGQAVFNRGALTDSPLADVCPTLPRLAPPAADDKARFTPTEAGQQHPILRGVDGSPVDGRSTAGAAAAASGPSLIWSRLPELVGVARLGDAKPLAVVLAADERGRPLLAGQEFGRGRSLAAAWEDTWPWALRSDEGGELHRRLWRQMAAWLANRRPTAWVVTEQPSYPRAALAAGQQTVWIRAGVASAEALAARAAGGERRPRLRMGRLAASATAPVLEGQPTSAAASVGEWDIPLRRSGEQWVAALPEGLSAADWLRAGEYELHFEAEPADPQRASEGVSSALTARTQFRILDVDVEMQEPTANLDLLRRAADRTSSVGGAYYPLERLAEVLQRLAATDRRRYVERQVRFRPSEQAPWLVLLLAVGGLAIEWAVRRRGGLT